MLVSIPKKYWRKPVESVSPSNLIRPIRVIKATPKVPCDRCELGEKTSGFLCDTCLKELTFPLCPMCILPHDPKDPPLGHIASCVYHMVKSACPNVMQRDVYEFVYCEDGSSTDPYATIAKRFLKFVESLCVCV